MQSDDASNIPANSPSGAKIGAATRRRAEAVGAANTLRPDGTRSNARCVRSVAEARVGYYVEQQAICVRKGDHEIGAGDLLMQRVHLGKREATDERTTLLLLAQDGRADEFG